MNTESFLIYIGEVLRPGLREGDMVICDNLSSHHSPGVRDLICSAGAELIYLPPYSPDLNPIEMAFSKLKAHLRKYIISGFDELCERLSAILPEFTPAKCRNFFSHANYTTN